MEFYSFILAIIGTICALAQVCIAIFSQDTFKKWYDEPAVGAEQFDSERFIKRSKFLFAFLFLSVIVSFLLWLIPQQYDWIIAISYVSPLICLLLFVRYAFMAKKSFETPSIIAPRGLWEILFNKIPSYVENAEGPYRIVLTQVGDVKGDELGKKLRDLEGKEIESLTPNNYELVENAYKQHTLDSSGTPLYEFDVYNNIKSVPCSQEPGLIHGIIVFVGTANSNTSVTRALRELAKRNPYVPMAYYSFSNYPGDDRIPPFTKLTGKEPKDFVNYLVLRHYSRCGYWKKLCNKYHRVVVGGMAFFGGVLLVLAAALIIKSRFCQTPLPSVESIKKSNRVRLANVFFENDSPARIKVWKMEGDKVNNIFNSGDGGDLSDFPKDKDSMIRDVLKNQVACLWVPKDIRPFTVWDKNGKQLFGRYFVDSCKVVVFNDAGDSYEVGWYKNKVKNSSLEDNRIRFMYSFDGIYAVEVVYDPVEYYRLFRKLIHTNQYLAKLQQFLLAFELMNENSVECNNCLREEKTTTD